jgi:hypothetical protein
MWAYAGGGGNCHGKHRFAHAGGPGRHAAWAGRCERHRTPDEDAPAEAEASSTEQAEA